MFTNTRQAAADRTAASLREALEGWRSTADSWYDGTPGAITARMAACDRIIHRLRQGGIGYHGTIVELASDRSRLADMRSSLWHTANQDRDQFVAPRAHEVTHDINRTAARAFVRENIEVAHVPEEMAERARRYAALVEPTANAESFAATCLRVAATVPRPKVASAPPPNTDFDDELMFM